MGTLNTAQSINHAILPFIRPPGTLVTKAFCFSRDVFFNQTQDLRAHSADRHKTLPRDHYLPGIENPGPKIRRALP